MVKPRKGGGSPKWAVIYSDSWLHDLMDRLGNEDPHEVFGLLCASLQALRDSLPPQEAALLGHHLPLLLRGVYLEGLRPVKLVRPRDGAATFLKTMRREAPNILFDPEQVAGTVLSLLADRVEQSACRKIFDALPPEILEIQNSLGQGSDEWKP
jgi:uncharacterized protein (DUF2267 family)